MTHKYLDASQAGRENWIAFVVVGGITVLAYEQGYERPIKSGS
jgi:hypothetical protein